MAKETTYKIVGDIVKGVGYNHKQFGVPVELTFADGRVVTYTYKADRKKDVVAAMQPNGDIAREAEAAHLDERGKLSFRYVMDGLGFRPDAEALI